MAGVNKGYEYREYLPAESAGLMVIDYLVARYPAVSRGQWLRRIASGRVLIDGVVAEADAVLSPGQCLRWLRPPWVEPEAPLDFAILYRDSHLLGIAKPAGLPTMPGGGRFMDNTLFTLVRRRYPGANPLHRLGRGTSGVMVFALTREAFAAVSKAWNIGQVEKRYRTLAGGLPGADSFDVDVPIGPVPHPVLKSIHAATPDGRPAHSRIEVLERRGDRSLLDVHITTGRPHQIRIHCAAAGHPLVGDPLYTTGGVPAANSLAVPGDLGYHLHSRLLALPHPATGHRTEIVCLPPPLLRPIVVST
ncbi:MAG TPA: RluA family pseudouridine synthase [Acidobacteriota bacterium]|nr:RluA family pseudouridine synthase [Acidobacteriota bacterium]